MQKQKHIYQYKGGVMRWGEWVGNFEGTTEAVSDKQALNNFKVRAKWKLGLASNTLIQLNPNNLKKLN